MSKGIADTGVVEVGRADHFGIFQSFFHHLSEALHKDNLVIMPDSLNCLVRSEIGLFALSVPQIIFPEAFKEQCIPLIHQEPLTVTLILLQHAYVSRASL